MSLAVNMFIDIGMASLALLAAGLVVSSSATGVQRSLITGKRLV